MYCWWPSSSGRFVQVKRLLREIDPAAFFIVCDAHEIFGEGFGDYQKEEI